MHVARICRRRHHAVDGAMELRFAVSESTFDYFEATRCYLQRHYGQSPCTATSTASSGWPAKAPLAETGWPHPIRASAWSGLHQENNDLYDYGTSPVENAMVVTQYDPTKNAVISYLNGTQVLSHSPPKANLNVNKAIHIGGGGDLSQPDPVRMREALVTNSVISASEVTAMKENITTFFSSLKFP